MYVCTYIQKIKTNKFEFHIPIYTYHNVRKSVSTLPHLPSTIFLNSSSFRVWVSLWITRDIMYRHFRSSYFYIYNMCPGWPYHLSQESHSITFPPRKTLENTNNAYIFYGNIIFTCILTLKYQTLCMKIEWNEININCSVQFGDDWARWWSNAVLSSYHHRHQRRDERIYYITSHKRQFVPQFG